MNSLTALTLQGAFRCAKHDGGAENVCVETLEIQLRHDLLRAARTFTPEEWAMLDSVRAEQASTGNGA